MPMHTIPQNVTSYEDKIVGIFVGRQFIYLAVGGLTAFILLSTGGGASQLFRFVLAFGALAFAAALALVKVNDRNFDVWVLSFLKSILGPTEWAWQKQSIPPAVLMAPDSTVIKQIAKPDTTNTEKVATYRFNAERKDAFKSFISGSSKDLDEDEQAFLQQLDFGVPLPRGHKITPTSRTAPPPMLTPNNPTRVTVASQSVEPWQQPDSLAAKPLAALAQSTLRPIRTFDIDGHQQQVGVMHNQRTNRSLSRQLLSSGVMPVPVRGEMRLNLDPAFQQELMGLIGFAPETQRSASLSAPATMPVSQPQTFPTVTPMVQHDTLNTITDTTAMDIKMQAASDFQSAPTNARHKLQIESNPINSTPAPPPSDVGAEQPAPPTPTTNVSTDTVSTGPVDERTAPATLPSIDSSLAEATHEDLPSDQAVETTTAPPPVESATTEEDALRKQVATFEELAKRAQEQLELERQNREALEDKISQQQSDAALLTQHYQEELSRIQERSQTAASQTQQAQQQLDSLQQQAASSSSSVNEDDVEQQRQLVEKLRQEEQRSAAFARELLEKMQHPTEPMPGPMPTAPQTETTTPPSTTEAQQPLAVSPDNLPTLTTQANVVNGFVFGSDGQFVDGAVVVIKDESGEAKRALKSNKLGQFVVTTPLANGRYVVEVDKQGLRIDTITIELKGQPVLPLVIQAKAA